MFFLFRGCGTEQAMLLLSLAILYCGGEIDDWVPRAYVTSLGRSPLKGFHCSNVLVAVSPMCNSHVKMVRIFFSLGHIPARSPVRPCIYSPVYLLETKASTLTIRCFCRRISSWGEGPHSAARWEASNLLGVLLLPGELQKNIYLNCTK